MKTSKVEELFRELRANIEKAGKIINSTQKLIKTTGMESADSVSCKIYKVIGKRRKKLKRIKKKLKGIKKELVRKQIRGKIGKSEFTCYLINEG
ncbi:MAG: hypothetical protein WCJ01_08995 [Ignavibacteria bacterium]